jgi:hypothetical protein
LIVHAVPQRDRLPPAVIAAAGDLAMDQTDAASDPGVKIVGTFPQNAHPPIIYPIAPTNSFRSSSW